MMDIMKKVEIKMTLNEDEACTIIYAIKLMQSAQENIRSHTHDYLIETALIISHELEDALKGPLDKAKQMNISAPKYTVLYNIVTANSAWVGTGWEFFDHDDLAINRYHELVNQGHCPCKRPYNEKCDRPHLGAAHMLTLEEKGQLL